MLETMEELHDEFRRLRNYWGLTQEQAADLCGVHANSIKRFEKGEETTGTNILKYLRQIEKWKLQVQQRWEEEAE